MTFPDDGSTFTSTGNQICLLNGAMPASGQMPTSYTFASRIDVIPGFPQSLTFPNDIYMCDSSAYTQTISLRDGNDSDAEISGSGFAILDTDLDGKYDYIRFTSQNLDQLITNKPQGDAP